MSHAATIEGYASLFNVADGGGDTVLPGAFAASLRTRGAGGVRFLFQHDPAQPIGRWTDLRETARGLLVRGEINLEVARGRELESLVREGAIDGLSMRPHRANPSRLRENRCARAPPAGRRSYRRLRACSRLPGRS